MGNRSSARPESLGPKSFYLVHGSPHIRYRYDQESGPLIYHAEMESTAAETMVERADSFPLTAAVSSKQPFLLTPRREGPTKSADLSFDIYMAKPIKKLTVYANMAVAYVEKKGLVLRTIPEQPHQPTCVYESPALDVTTSTVTTTSPIFYTALTTATFSATISAAHSPRDEQRDASATQYVTRAPLVIVLELPDLDARELPNLKTKEEQRAEEEARRDDTNEDETAEARGQGHGDGDAEQRASMAGAASTMTTGARGAPPTRARVLQFTFLDFESGAAPTVRDPGVADAEPVPVKMKVVKQLLQLGTEVYELDDIFDLGNNFQPPPAAEDGDNEGGDPLVRAVGSDDEDNDENLCVVCLSNTKDTAILPCRHMCVCHDCAAQLRLNNNKCPICRCDIERVLTI